MKNKGGGEEKHDRFFFTTPSFTWVEGLLQKSIGKVVAAMSGKVWRESKTYIQKQSIKKEKDTLSRKLFTRTKRWYVFGKEGIE